MGVPFHFLSSFPFLLLLLITTISNLSKVSSYNITTFLAPLPEFSVFNEILTASGFAEHANHQEFIAVLAVPNDGIGDAALKAPKKRQGSYIMRHILTGLTVVNLTKINPDEPTFFQSVYFNLREGDPENGKPLITTAFRDKQKGIYFGSPENPFQAKLLKIRQSDPNGLSVLEVSQLIGNPEALDSVEAPTPSEIPKAAAPTEPNFQNPSNKRLSNGGAAPSMILHTMVTIGAIALFALLVG